jgi:hypothetical protein
MAGSAAAASRAARSRSEPSSRNASEASFAEGKQESRACSTTCPSAESEAAQPPSGAISARPDSLLWLYHMKWTVEVSSTKRMGDGP